MADAATLKEEGNVHFKAGHYAQAVDCYTRSLELDDVQHLVLSNRSAAYLKLGGAEESALKDAQRCMELEPTFAKGYSRQAAALQALKRWEEAVAVCEKGMAVAPDDTVKKMLSECRIKHFVDKVHGPWHGRVSEQLGGYEQEMEFVAGGKVEVTVLGRSVMGTYWLDCDKNPHDLTIQVPMPDAPPGMPPPPPINYIVKLDDLGLHICCPSNPMEHRPTSFSGPGYCVMERGKLPSANAAALLEGLSEDEKHLLCAKELTEALPPQKLEELMPTDSEDVSREKLMAQVKFESAMFALKQKFGDDLITAVIDAGRGDGKIPVCLADTAELRSLRDRLVQCELIPPEAGAVPMRPPAPQAAAAGARAPSPSPPQRQSSERGESDAPLRGASAGSCAAVGVALGLAVAIIAGAFAWQRRRR